MNTISSINNNQQLYSQNNPVGSSKPRSASGENNSGSVVEAVTSQAMERVSQEIKKMREASGQVASPVKEKPKAQNQVELINSMAKKENPYQAQNGNALNTSQGASRYAQFGAASFSSNSMLNVFK